MSDTNIFVPPHSHENEQPNGVNGSSSLELGRSRRVVGFHEANVLAGQHMVNNIQRLEEMNPMLGRSILENGFGGTTTNVGFGYREWALQTLGVLTAMGDCADQLDVYLEAAFKHGATGSRYHQPCCFILWLSSCCQYYAPMPCSDCNITGI